MKPEKILKLAIEKAKKNGWDIDQYDFALKKFKDSWRLWDSAWLENIIFSHSFAKAFWGEGDANWHTSFFGIELHKTESRWQYYLQQMVLEKEPLKYLEKFL